MADVKLEPCKACGGEGRVAGFAGNAPDSVKCRACGCHLSYAAWNLRAHPSAEPVRTCPECAGPEVVRRGIVFCCEGGEALHGVAHPSAERVAAVLEQSYEGMTYIEVLNLAARDLERLAPNPVGKQGAKRLRKLLNALAALRATPAEPSQEAERVRALEAALKEIKKLTDARAGSECGFDECEKVFVIAKTALRATDGGKVGEG